MWTYHTTTATPPASTAVSSTAGFSSSWSSRGISLAYADSATVFGQGSVTFAETAVTQPDYESYRRQTVGQTSGSVSGSNRDTGTVSLTGAQTYSAEEVVSHGYTRSETHYTTASNGASTTSSSEDTATRARASYVSNLTTEATTAAATTTTTVTATVTQTTSQTGPATRTTTATASAVTTTTSAAGVTRTTYATAAATTLAAPEYLAPVTVAAATEQLWSVSLMTDSAGYPAAIAASVTARTGTLASTSVSLSILTSEGPGFTSQRTHTSAATTITLTTTATVTTADTYVPPPTAYPATATATRAFTLLTTQTTSLATLTTGTATVSFAFAHSTNYVAATETIIALHTATAPITLNVNPTLTAADTFHLTWRASSTITLRRLQAVATSASTAETSTASATVTEAADTTTATTASDSYTTAGTFPSYTTTTDTTVSTSTAVVGPSTVTYDGTYSATTNITLLAPDGGSQSEDQASYSTFFTSSSYYATNYQDGVFPNTTDYSEFGSFYTEASGTTYGTTLRTTTIAGGIATVTEFVTTADFYSQFTSEYYASSQFYSFILLTGSSNHTETFTSAGSFSDSYSESYEADPITQDTTTALPTTLSYTTTVNTTASTATDTTTAETVPSTSGTITATETATSTTDTEIETIATFSTQSGETSSSENGLSFTYPRLVPVATTTAAAAWTVHAMHPAAGWRSPHALAAGDAIYLALSLTPALPLPAGPRATQDDASGPLTPILGLGRSAFTTGGTGYTVDYTASDSRLHYTSGATAGTTTASGTASFAGASAATWYAPRSTARAASTNTGGSVIGGAPVKSAHDLLLIVPPGLRRETTQSAGSVSASFTTRDLAPATFAGTSHGVALPLRDESVWSVRPAQTTWSYDTALGILLTGATAAPVFTLSLNPNL